MPEIRKYINGNSEPNSLEVYTYPKPKDKNISLAIITWTTIIGPRDVSFKTLIDKESMSYEQAIQWATEFAQKNNIPIVFDRNLK